MQAPGVCTRVQPRGNEPSERLRVFAPLQSGGSALMRRSACLTVTAVTCPCQFSFSPSAFPMTAKDNRVAGIESPLNGVTSSLDDSNASSCTGRKHIVPAARYGRKLLRTVSLTSLPRALREEEILWPLGQVLHVERQVVLQHRKGRKQSFVARSIM